MFEAVGTAGSLPEKANGTACSLPLQRFKLCSAANGRKEETKAVKLATLLEGEAQAVCLDLNEDDKKSYDKAKEHLIEVLMPMGFTVLDKFHTRRLQSGEALSA